MRTLVLLTVLSLVVCVQASANPIPEYYIGLYGDVNGTVSYIYDDGPGELNVYVVHHVWPDGGSVGVRFSAPPPLCFQAVYVGETSAHTSAGDSQNGLFVMFNGGCQNGAILVLTITYSVTGETGDCCVYPLGPYPDSGQIERWDCTLAFHSVWSESLTINLDSNWCTDPVEETTWGRIKAMYNG
jgi:hypothetical protein